MLTRISMHIGILCNVLKQNKHTDVQSLGPDQQITFIAEYIHVTTYRVTRAYCQAHMHTRSLITCNTHRLIVLRKVP